MIHVAYYTEYSGRTTHKRFESTEELQAWIQKNSIPEQTCSDSERSQWKSAEDGGEIMHLDEVYHVHTREDLPGTVVSFFPDPRALRALDQFRVTSLEYISNFQDRRQESMTWSLHGVRLNDGMEHLFEENPENDTEAVEFAQCTDGALKALLNDSTIRICGTYPWVLPTVRLAGEKKTGKSENNTKSTCEEDTDRKDNKWRILMPEWQLRWKQDIDALQRKRSRLGELLKKLHHPWNFYYGENDYVRKVLAPETGQKDWFIVNPHSLSHRPPEGKELIYISPFHFERDIQKLEKFIKNENK